jgi:phosphate:Na+ symporter
MVGVSQMSEGLEKSALKKIQKILQKISDNRFVGLGIGTVVTAVIHSSAATTVMSIGFVNAGVMSLEQACAIILGANIGTTFTGLFAVLSTFDFSKFLSLLAIIGVFMQLLAKKEGTKLLGQILCGLGLIFIGLDIMSSAFKTPELNETFSNIFQTLKNPFVLIIIAMIITGLIQSSSAIVGVVIVLASTGAIPMSSALYVVLGADVGTCITGLIASIGTNVNAKRTAMIQLIFNLIGVVIFFVIVLLFNSQIISLLSSIAPGAPALQVAFFHMSFNLITALLGIPFVKALCNLTRFLIKDKTNEENQLKLLYIDELLLKTPQIALAYVQKEVARMMKLSKQSIDVSLSSIIHMDNTNTELIKQNEELIDYLNMQIASYLVKLSSKPITLEDEMIIGKLHHIINDIERIGDHAQNFMDEANVLISSGINFSAKATEELQTITNTLMEMFVKAEDIFINKNSSKLNYIAIDEKKLDQLKIQLDQNHINRLKNNECTIETGHYFYTLTSEIERCGDHLINIAFSLISIVGNETGDKTYER